MKLTNVKIKPVYNSYDDDIIDDFYNKLFEYANHYDRASAYFDSKILALYAKGLEKIYDNNGKIRFIFSYQLNPDDFEKMQRGYETRTIENNLSSAINIDELTDEQKIDFSNLALLISKNLVDIKIAYTKAGIFHDKFGLIYDDENNYVYFRGSNNETVSAAKYSYESFETSCSWDKVENENIKILQERQPRYIMPKLVAKNTEKENVIKESMEVTQGKLVLGLDIKLENEKQKYDALLYNSILGGTANSKMFQNVREKAHLAYVASSSYIRQKSNIFINCGIEISNYEKALEIVKKQIEDMRKGNFTEEDIENSKKGIISTIDLIEDEQDTGITYYFGQELSNNKIHPEEYKEIVQKVKKEDIVKIANSVSIDTIYFLKD